MISADELEDNTRTTSDQGLWPHQNSKRGLPHLHYETMPHLNHEKIPHLHDDNHCAAAYTTYQLNSWCEN